ncbi:ROK family protein [Candidatus Parcubacteria bacterium]|uniref:ROK family protein n=1 Tax=Candidatus Kaiserbacteria bacterium CG10_big_fil_rev_8_21_14_0_10_47_16 TaxID=1974608 RepID=A0A2H0UES8_9BACT|nr:ROK family protein [Candidatus Parcubacteria bacterium]PIR84275.1 MAG: hypothetical protein COU16_01610 [Candidatus Kaiserbacteria bacterium CG10_big_fil_rev_8_21_14_0_10_47_16]
MQTYILFDIGGTKTRVAVSTDLQSFKVEKFDTPASYAEGIAAITEAVRTLNPATPITLVAGGIRGELNATKTELVSEKILTDWVDKPLAKDLEAAFVAPILLRNDAEVAALGEASFGAGRGYSRISYHTVSTGVGGALVSEGKVIATHNDLVGGPHTIEDQISGTALEQQRGMKPYEIPQSDPVWNVLAEKLAHALVNVVTAWSPDAIVLGGSMIVGDPRILLADITRHTTELLPEGVACPAIVDASLKDEAGLYGAMAVLATLEQSTNQMKGTWTNGLFRYIAGFFK